jgi:hypothetical protein
MHSSSLVAIGDLRGQATALEQIGFHWFNHLGDPLSGPGYYQQALTLWRAVGNRVGEAECLNDIGLIYGILGEPQKALEYFEQVLLIDGAMNRKREQAVTINDIGYVLSRMGTPARIRPNRLVLSRRKFRPCLQNRRISAAKSGRGARAMPL